jgi:deoxycytidylate deaminase
MTFGRHVHDGIPALYRPGRYDVSCLHFAKLFKGNKPIGNWMPNSTDKHAEHNALRALRTQKRRINPHLTMVVVRFDRAHTHLLMSKPCSGCVELLRAHRIRTVVYSDERGMLVKESTSHIRHKPSSMAPHIPTHGRVVSYSKFKDAP